MDALLKRFDFDHLSGSSREVARACHDLALDMATKLPECSELGAALLKLIDVRDLLVRAAEQMPAAEETSPSEAMPRGEKRKQK